MISVVPSKIPYAPSYYSSGTAEYLSVYLSSKILGGFCEIDPLTPQRVYQIAQEGSFSSLLDGQTGFRVSIARQFLLPLLESYLPELIEKKLKEATSVVKKPITFPNDHFHATLQELIGYYSDVIRAYRETAKEPYLTKTIDKTVEEKLQHIYLVEGQGEETLLILSIQKILEEVVFKKSLDSIPWPFKGPASLFLYSISFSLRHVLPLFARSLPKTSDPIADQLEIFVRVAACRFLKDLKQEMRRSSHTPLSLDRGLLEKFMQKEVLVSRLCTCTSQEQIERVLKDNSILQWVQDAFVYKGAAKEIETMIGIAWSIIKRPSWREREANHFFHSLDAFFENPASLLEEPSDIDQALHEFIEEILGQKLPTYLDFVKQPIASLAIMGKKVVMERRKEFWLKPYSLRFGLLHRQVLMRWLCN
jgi:hypothetical protein